MLRPKQMSRVSVTGSKRVMDDVIETVHDLNLVHVTDYDGSWEGFEPGDPVSGAEAAAQKLVTVRSLESILDVDPEDAGPTRTVGDEELEAELEEIRQEVNELDDRRSALRDELRQVREDIENARPFAELGIDLDLLHGYSSVSTAVGEGDEEAIRRALADADAIDRFETFADGGYVAVVAYPAVDVEDALVGTQFTRYAVPEPAVDGAVDPESYIEELEHRERRLESQLDTVAQELESVKHEVAGFLLAAEEKLSIEVQKREAPLTFATTENAFVAEGWIPTDRFDDLVTSLHDTVADHVEIEELARARYDSDGFPTGHEEIDHERETPGSEEAVASDGGTAETDYTMATSAPPVVQDNPDIAEPFELMVETANRPKYTEIDPTLIIFLTFPFAFGFMIGDIGYGLLYMAMGYAMWQFDSDAVRSLGSIAVWAGFFTVVFGYLYDDFFGVHMHDVGLHLPLAGTLDKGLHLVDWALLWVVISIIFGLLHLTVGYVLGFINDRPHGLWEAAVENLSWAVALNGFFVWVFSTHLLDQKPAFVAGEEAVLGEFIGFAGFPATVGIVALALAGVGVVGVIYGEGMVGAVEIPSLLANSLSYLRIVAVLLAKGGMAFAVNLLVFGAYETPDHKVVFNLPGQDVSGYEEQFFGLLHVDPLPLGILLAVIVFVLGHILVLLLGITAAGIQMARLEYVEFFEKFYEGGGEKYEPFGYQRTYTEE